jgi:hypothetical protein
VQTDITSKGLRDSEEERGQPQRFKFLCHDIGDTATQERVQVLTCQPILSRHYTSMTQDGLQIAGTFGGRGRAALPPTHSRIHLSDWPVGCATAQGWGARPFICFSPV